MTKYYITSLVLIAPIIAISVNNTSPAQENDFRYPYILLDSYNPDNDCWTGMDANGIWPVRVYPEKWLVNPPDPNVTGVTIPTDHWVELKFRGEIIDGIGDDIILAERDQMGEQALIFLTDGLDREYLLGLAAVSNDGTPGPTTLGFDTNGLWLPFASNAVRILGVDLLGGSPGFDLSYIKAQIFSSCSNIAYEPNPANMSTNIPIDSKLSWSSGCFAQKHIVYFGTSHEEVSINSNSDSFFHEPQDTNNFDPGILELNKTYYWRIDEVNNANSNSPWTGDIWKFSTTDHIVVEDFESYRSNSRLNAKWSATSTANIKISKKEGPIEKCQQSMQFSFNLSTRESLPRAIHTFNNAQDWTIAGINSMDLYFSGDTDNYIINTQMYLILSDGNAEYKIPYDGDPNNLQKEKWRPWRINLLSFSDIDLSNIEYMAIGFENFSEQNTFDYGDIYFDDIRLYPSRCLDENVPQADINKDCRVNYEDIETIANNWLDNGYKTFEISVPNAPLAWYQFDGNTNDIIGNAHGSIKGNPSYVPGIYGQAVKFDGYEDSVEVNDAQRIFSKINTAITIAFWQYGLDSIHHTDTLFCTDYKYNSYNPAIAINLGCWKKPGKYNWDCGSPWSFGNRLSGKHKSKDQWSGRWNHWAFTKDKYTSIMQIFLNGDLIDSKTGSDSFIAGIISFEIGSGWYGGYDGLIDDFRIYDYALSPSEIAYVATNGTGFLDLPIVSPANLIPDNRIDFHDFAFLAEIWLSKHLYP